MNTLEKITPDDLRELRDRLGLTQSEVAARVGVSSRAWGAYERGEYEPSAPVLILVAQLLKKTRKN